MMTRLGQSWQLLLADLSLILFVTTAAAMSVRDAEPAALADAVLEPVALYRDGGDPGQLARWVAAYRPDPREQLTITIRHRPGELSAALSRASELAQAAERGGTVPRIVLEESPREDALASFAFAGLPVMARNLHVSSGN